MDNCIICLESNEDKSARITTLSSEWMDGQIHRIIEKHLWWWHLEQSLQHNGFVRWICRHCWKEISTFHNFYCKVEMVHRNYQQTMRTTMVQSNFAETLEKSIIKQEIESNVESNSTNYNTNDIPMKEIKSEFCCYTNNDSDMPEAYNEYRSPEAICLEPLNIKEELCKEFESEDEEPLKNNIKTVNKQYETENVWSGKTAQETLIQDKTVNQNDNFNEKTDQFEDLFKDLKCNNCDVPLKDFRMLRIHYRKEHNTKGFAICCGKKFFKRFSFVDHLRLHKDPNFFKCQICTKTFSSSYGLDKHMESHKAPDEVVKKVHKSKGKELEEFNDFFKDQNCLVCNIPLLDFKTLKTHYRHEHNIDGYVMCCEKKYFKRYLLVEHLRLHADPNIFKCQSCTKTFGTQGSFELHLQSHEPRERKYKCDQCDKTFFALRNFEIHKLTHVPESDKNFSCSQCNKKFGSDYLKRKHVDLKHANKYVRMCDICGKTFSRSQSFIYHMEVHAGTQSLVNCEICGLELTKTYLRQHRKIKHMNQNN
ncbi:zinc finger protein 62 homolog [Calliphora vicina]|uniref:zinc finger protein 62 homolog n=1 Tax=Calliphora vicina TaxID=7373 RepID=UPI00325B94CA